ncbi:alpha/beta hydrolase [Streptomyces sparsogenes]|uniref:alpha/beta hydrolase n=1 Tax=Streptomyces sparsogenes TaxID=67365 RepID=UPI0034011AA1
MRAVRLYGVLGPLSLALAMTGLLAAPAPAAPAHAAPAAVDPADPAVVPLGAEAATLPSAGSTAEDRGVALAARRAAARGIGFGRCPAVEELPGAARCGTVKVPLDYAHPRSAQLSLTVSRIRATGPRARRQGALVYNPGGPGASGMAFPTYAGMAGFRAAAEAYDFVGYAPRGVDRSGPLSCQDPAAFAKAPANFPVHPSAAFKRKMIKRAKAYARGCARRAGRALRHYTTLNNARDLDVLRAALGEKRLTFVGASYGTYYGAVYATLFPTHVRRMVFDSVVDPDPRQIWYRSNLRQSLAFERRWRDWRRWVARHDAVYHLGDTAAEVFASYEKARRRLARHPAGGKVGTAQLQDAYLQTGYNDAFWDVSAHALAAYLRGDTGPLVTLAAPDPTQAVAEENGNAVYTAVQCNDAPWPRSWARWNRDNTALARRAPFETWDNVAMNLPCAYWPAPHRRPLRVGPGGGAGRGAPPPVLLLAAERDAATPYAGARELWHRLPGSSLVTERKAGTHGLWGGPNDCVNAYVDTYLLTGRTPGRSVSCAPRAAPEPTAWSLSDPAQASPATSSDTGLRRPV